MAEKNTGSGRKSELSQTVVCECGSKILVIPDIKEMSAAIENHVWEHIKNEKDQSKVTCEKCRLMDLLVAQVLKVASDSKQVQACYRWPFTGAS